MLARESRLNKKSDIVKTIRYGRRIRTPYVLLYVLKPDPLPKNTQVAVVVGKKVSKVAVKRHRYQRLLREIAREYITDLPPLYMVWVGIPPLHDVTSKEELERSLAVPLKKLQALT